MDKYANYLDDEDLFNEKLFGNLRELLWYWKEYYLRRGRDRLSLEFSSHINFSVLANVVCKFLY